MNAHEVLQGLNRESTLEKVDFDKLVAGFRTNYLADKNYTSRLTVHRKPAELNDEVLQDLYTEIRLIQQRKELQHIDIQKKAHTYIPTMVADIFHADKNVKSLYDAITIYCNQYGRDFMATAVHLAEYRALSKLCVIIRGKNNKLLAIGAKKAAPPFGRIHFIDIAPLIKGMQDIEAGRSHVAPIETQYFLCEQTETVPPEGLELPPLFPNCCETHKALFSRGLDILDRFPDCCQGHRKLKAAPWFRKEDYRYLPVKFVNAVTYTWHCVETCIEHAAWYKEITDYIAYTHNSFGQFPKGYGGPLGVSQYLDHIIHYIKKSTVAAPEKKDALLRFIEQQYYSGEAHQVTDVNLLIGEYKKWLKIFPFDISFFAPLKPRIDKNMPILSGPGETNMYTGLTAFKLKTRQELFQHLANLTKQILEHINTAKLYRNGLLQDPTVVAIEILTAKRQLALEAQLNADCVERSQYIKFLKKWLNDEKAFLRELAPLLKKKENEDLFISYVVQGIRQLQLNGINAHCIAAVRENKPDKEAAFRNWFRDFLAAKYAEHVVTAEEQLGKGRIDLKIHDTKHGSKIIEFKGWWNQGKHNTTQQLCSYLTEFEKCGYIVMINNTKKDISAAYKDHVTTLTMAYVEGSWKEHTLPNTSVSYFESTHLFAVKQKTVYHFIFNVYY